MLVAEQFVEVVHFDIAVEGLVLLDDSRDLTGLLVSECTFNYAIKVITLVLKLLHILWCLIQFV